MFDSLEKFIINNIDKEPSDIKLYNAWSQMLVNKPSFAEAIACLELIKLCRDDYAFECLGILNKN